MDNYDKVLDLIEHPHNYSAQQMEQLLSDPEAREIYNLLCKTESTCKASAVIDDAEMDAEWKRFSQKHFENPLRTLWLGGRAASITIFALTSLVAVAIGVVVTVNVFNSEPKPTIVPTEKIKTDVKTLTDTIPADVEGVPVSPQPILFEDETLAGILDAVGRVYSVTVSYRSAATAQLHLYYRFDPGLPLLEIVEQLNTFEQINLLLDGTTLIVD